MLQLPSLVFFFNWTKSASDLIQPKKRGGRWHPCNSASWDHMTPCSPCQVCHCSWPMLETSYWARQILGLMYQGLSDETYSHVDMFGTRVLNSFALCCLKGCVSCAVYVAISCKCAINMFHSAMKQGSTQAMCFPGRSVFCVAPRETRVSCRRGFISYFTATNRNCKI